MVAQFQPKTANDHALVETMAIALWRQMRNATLLTATLEIEMAAQGRASGNAPVLAAKALRTLADCSQVLAVLQRYETSNSRLYSRAFADLIKARNNTKSGQDDAFSPPQPSLSLALAGTWESEEDDIQEFPNKANSLEKPLEHNDSKTEND